MCSRAASFVNGQAARAVIGQTNFTNAADIPTAQVLGGAGGVAYSGGKLFVAEGNRLGATPVNNRVLIFGTTQIPGPTDDPSSVTPPSAQCGLCGYNATTVVGQVDFNSNAPGRGANYSGSGDSYAGALRNPTGIASNGTILAVADTDNNRVLLWNTLPQNSQTPPNVVLGQINFTSFQTPQPVNANSLRGPQGVWIQGNKLFVADTQNHRVLIWNNIPTQNNQAADVVLGQVNFGSSFSPPPTSSNPPTAADRLYSPTSVTSDGQRLFVSDLGSNRVLIWNSIPTANTTPANVVVGQPDMTTGVPNWRDALCDDKTAARCSSTLNFPRYALSDGTRLFIADAGNDRVLVFNNIPTANGARADYVLGQPDFATDIVTNAESSIASTAIDNNGAVDTLPSPTSLAWDGTNLYVADPYNRRISIFSQGDVGLPVNSVVNWASEIIRQEGVVVISVATITANDTATITIAGTGYTYTVKAGDTATTIAQGLVSAINANNGDPNVTALLGSTAGTVYLSSKGTNLAFDAISLAASVSNTANLAATASGSYLSAGTAATAAPGMLVEINAPSGTTLADETAAISDPATSNPPSKLGNVQVFMDGNAQPLVKVSPSQVVALVPWTFIDRNSSSIYVRTGRANGTTTVSNATSVYIAPANPGLFSDKSSGTAPFPALQARHQPGNPSCTVSIDGTAKAGDTATITVVGRSYSYTVKTGEETLAFIVLRLVEQIRADPDVTADIGAAFNRVIVTARKGGIAGNGIAVTGSTSANAQVTVTPYTAATCCDVVPNTPLTVNNPARVGEPIILTAAGLGTVALQNQPVAGQLFNGPVPNNASNSVSATMGGSTAQIVYAGVPTGSYGKYEVQMIVPANLGVNNATQTYIAQNAFVSNIVTIPVGTPTGLPDPPVGTPAPPTPICSYALSATSKSYFSGAGAGSIGVNAPTGCSWTASVDASWISITSATTASGTAALNYTFTANTTGADRSAVLTVAGQSFTVTQSANSTPATAALRFVPLPTPCRALDTRASQGPLISGGTTRDFGLTTTGCGIPSTVQAYALNVTVVPSSTLTYLTVFPSGTSRPLASTLNSFDGRIKSNAAVVPAGSGGSVAAFATDDTHLVLDITGYFVPASTSGSLAFYPLVPCRVMDTRNAAGGLGGPSLTGGATRSIPVLSSTCGIPASGAQAYSLNVTAVPKAPLTYLTMWPGGQPQPATSTLNAPTGTPVANAAIIPAGANGSLSVLATANTDLVVDINGYFAAPSNAGALNFYPATPCRVFDNRFEQTFTPATAGQTAAVNVAGSGCGAPASAQYFAMNVTALPQPVLQYLTLWQDASAAQPVVSTLNGFDGSVTSNLAIVPASAQGSIAAYTSESTYLIFDLLGYFAP